MLDTEKFMAKRRTVDDLSNEVEVVKKAIAIKEDIYKNINTVSGDYLSKKGMELSIYLVNIGQLAATAAAKANYSYAYRKFKFAKDFKSMRRILSAVKDSEMSAQEMVENEVIQEIEAQYEADMVKSLYEDLERCVSFIQTRLRHMGGERTRTFDQP